MIKRIKSLLCIWLSVFLLIGVMPVNAIRNDEFYVIFKIDSPEERYDYTGEGITDLDASVAESVRVNEILEFSDLESKVGVDVIGWKVYTWHYYWNEGEPYTTFEENIGLTVTESNYTNYIYEEIIGLTEDSGYALVPVFNTPYYIDLSGTNNGTANITGGATYEDESYIAYTGDEIMLEALPDLGYHFQEWKVLDSQSNSITVDNNKFTMPSSDVNVEAIFEKNSITHQPSTSELYVEANGDTSKYVWYSVKGEVVNPGPRVTAYTIGNESSSYSNGRWTPVIVDEYGALYAYFFTVSLDTNEKIEIPSLMYGGSAFLEYNNSAILLNTNEAGIYEYIAENSGEYTLVLYLGTQAEGVYTASATTYTSVQTGNTLITSENGIYECTVLWEETSLPVAIGSPKLAQMHNGRGQAHEDFVIIESAWINVENGELLKDNAEVQEILAEANIPANIELAN